MVKIRQVLPIMLGVFLAFIIVSTYGLYSQQSEVFSVQNKQVPVFETHAAPKTFSTDIFKNVSGTYSLYTHNVITGNTVEYNPDEVMYAASLYKIPVAVAALKYEKGTYETLSSLIKESRNQSQEDLLNLMTPAQVVDAFRLGKELELTNYYYTNEVSSKEFVRYFEKMLSSDYLKKDPKNLLLDMLSETIYDDRIHAGLSSSDIFAHKIGNWPDEGSWHDCGILNKQTTVCLMSKNTTYSEFLIIARKVGEYISQ